MSLSALRKTIGHHKTFIMFLLVILTLSTYLVVWLTARKKVFNKIAKKTVISDSSIIWLLTICIFPFFIDQYIISSLPPSDDLNGIFNLIDIGCTIAFFIQIIVFSFKIADSISSFASSSAKDDIKFNKFYLVIFNLFYINYKINSFDDE